MTRRGVFGSALVAFPLALAACNSQIDAGGAGVDAGIEDDPLLSIAPDFEAGSLEELQVTIIQERCSGQPGLCHNGQFEPNLSTTANTYAYLVNRPAIENGTRLRVNPGDPGASFLIDKLRDRNVQTQMPLGAEPLSEAEIQALEDWISDGALRGPDADAPIKLNEPPLPPEIGAFSSGGARLDSVGSFNAAKGTTVTFRHSVSDFETADADIPFGVLILIAPDGMNLVIDPGNPNPEDLDTGVTVFDPSGPMGAGDVLNYQFDVAIPADGVMDLIDDNTDTVQSGVDVTGMAFTPIVLYLDEFPGGIVAFSVGANQMVVQ